MQLDVEVSPPASVIHLIYCNWWMASNCLRMDHTQDMSKVQSDLRPWPMTFGLAWPLALTLDTCYFEVMSKACKNHGNHIFWNRDLDLWPMTLMLIGHLDIINVHHHTKFGDPNVNDSWDMNYCPVNFGPVSFGPVTDRQKAMHKSPPCISTGVLKNYKNQNLQR